MEPANILWRCNTCGVSIPGQTWTRVKWLEEQHRLIHSGADEDECDPVEGLRAALAAIGLREPGDALVGPTWDGERWVGEWRVVKASAKEPQP